MSLFRFDMASVRANPVIRIWRHRNFALFMSGIGPFYTTGWMQRLAVGWMAWELTRSHAWVGAVAAADLAPMMVLGPLAGALIDRTDPLKQMRWTQLVIMSQALLLAVTTVSGHMSIWLLFALSLLTGVIQPIYTAARQTVVPSMVPREEFPTAVSLDSSIFHGSRFIGPMLAAVVIPIAGVAGAFFAHVAGCLAFVVQVRRIKMPPPDRSARARSSFIADLGAGLSYVRRHQGLRPLFLLLFVISIVARPMQDLLPGFADEVFLSGATGLAWLTSAMGIGSLLSAMFLATRGRVEGLTHLTILSSAGLGLSTIAFVATPNLAAGVVSAVGWGFTLTLMGVSIQAMTQTVVSNQMRGRVMILVAMIYRGVPALGAVIVGVLAEHVGLRLAFGVSGVICLVAWLVLTPRQGRIDHAMSERPEGDRPIR
ncbi:MAG: MFS transporter [Hyphomicrobiaceae bacterium]